MNLPGVLQRIDPSGTPSPLVFDLPHSGRDYPEDFGSTLPHAILRRAEDAHVGELLEGVTQRGVTMLRALFPRTYIDTNRDEADIDATLLGEQWPHDLRPGPKTELGIGLIRRVIEPGVPIYERKLSIEEVRHRIERYYRPYRRALSEMIAQRHRQYGRVLHVDWHSMKSAGNKSTPDGDGAERADFVLGDLRGLACDTEITERVADRVRELGYTVAVNDPYQGGDILRSYGRPASGVHSLQIEINRGIYMNEDSGEKTANFARLNAHLTGPVLDRLVELIPPNSR